MNRDNFETERDILEAAEESHQQRDYVKASEALTSTEERVEAMQREQETPDYESAADRERQRIESELEGMLRPAELKAADENGQTATEYARAELGVSGVIESMVQDDRHSAAFKSNQIKSALPSRDHREGNETAEFVLTPGEIEAAKDARISAEEYIEREYGIKASLYDKHALQRAISEASRE